MNKKTVTGRTPSQPEMPWPQCPAVVSGRVSATCQNTSNTPKRLDPDVDDVEQFFIDVFSGQRAPTAQGRFRVASGQMQNIPRGPLVNADYEKLERRVSASPAFAAPYGLAMDTPGGDAQPTLLDMIAHGQTDKDNADE